MFLKTKITGLHSALKSEWGGAALRTIAVSIPKALDGGESFSTNVYDYDGGHGSEVKKKPCPM